LSSARAALRAATAAEHERVDRLFSGLDLANPADYRLFLLAQASAFLPVEAAIDKAGGKDVLPDWPDRRRGHLLGEDLRELGAKPEPLPSPSLADPPSILGAIYVLEGSRLGGALLKRSLSETAPKRFLHAPQPAGSWRKLLEKLDLFLYRPDLLDKAVSAARDVFQRFEAGGLRYLETRVE
jgi:heme oxygenase